MSADLIFLLRLLAFLVTSFALILIPGIQFLSQRAHQTRGFDSSDSTGASS